MKIAGIEIPKRLEFGNEDHIKIARTVEQRLNLLDEGIQCEYCGELMSPIVNYENEKIRWECNYCDEFAITNLEGEWI